MTAAPGRALDARERLDWLHLARVEGLGPRGFEALLRRAGSAGEALRLLADPSFAPGRRLVVPRRDDVETEFERAARLGIRFLALPDPDYPALMRAVDGAPPVLSVKGQVALLARPAVALVGARNASGLGRKMAGLLASGLSEAGYVIVSGLARGIDTEAHRAGLAGGTVAVLAGGLERPYPPENEALFDAIAEDGLVLSEMRLWQGPRGQDFPRRNRLISALSLGVVVVEAARRSGSLITARMAGEQGRDVMAVPGSPLDPRCEGSNDLLRDGATLVTSVADVLAALPPVAHRPEPPLCQFREPAPDLFRAADAAEGPGRRLTGLGPAQGHADAVLDLLTHGAIDIDELGRMAGLDAASLSGALFDLELSGLIERLPGNRVAQGVMSAPRE
ncbi:MAG: DNA-processing protein DprA [Beijerinckiaceae bacterium]|nr:DNA-processing protein DprA [Beijerinckiaceae bacterium]MCZ8299595.1 DNA-processing protein DprA [Beijerinckiaceae bacterium]